MKVVYYLFLIAITASSVLGGRKRVLPSSSPDNIYDQSECHGQCAFGYFNCDCEKQREVYLNPSKCIPSSWMCDGKADCDDESDEFECSCDDNEMQCSVCNQGGGCTGNVTLDLYQCSSLGKINDTEIDCLSRKDEPRLFSNNSCIRCDGKIDCPFLDHHDEESCQSCPESSPNRCECNGLGSCRGSGKVCYSDAERCDGRVDCTDASDEVNCPCSNSQFACQCSKTTPPSCNGPIRCIPIGQYHDGIEQCPDGSDETPFARTVRCDQCDVSIFRLQSLSECNNIGFPRCDNSSCYQTAALNCTAASCDRTEVICTSYCDNSACQKGFQCSDGSLALSVQFCDGKRDCPDNSDEMRSGPGFRCVKDARACVLPQRNLNNAVSHCNDESDFCDNNACFQCLDKRAMISVVQKCNGVIDCYDHSDECLCENPHASCADIFGSTEDRCSDSKPVQKQNVNKNQLSHETSSKTANTITCQTKYGKISATRCDGIPECKDFSDECSCADPPAFCNDGCGSFYLLGDRYCDGILDEAYKSINKPNCPRGFDEKHCPHRFNCKAGNRMSIPQEQVCDGIRHCDDGADEVSCSPAAQMSRNRIIAVSSSNELIPYPDLKGLIWFMACLAIICNLIIIAKLSRQLMQKEDLNQSRHYRCVILLNIAISDLIMGCYLLAISIESTRYSGIYSAVDYIWRTSSECSFVGALAIISSEASCFLMVVLTGFLFHYVWKRPEDVYEDSKKVVAGIGIGLAWIVALILAVIPLSNGLSKQFSHGLWLKQPFSNKLLWSFNDLQQLTCSLAKLNNTSSNPPADFEAAASFLDHNYPEFVPSGVFSYYGETSLCLPEMHKPESSSVASKFFLGLIATNFTLYICMGVCYLMICWLQSIYHKVSAELSPQPKDLEPKDLALIGKIIITNILVWFAIGIIAFLSATGTEVPNYAYTFSICVLLPLNGALNPLLHHSFMKSFRCMYAAINKRKGKAEIEQA